jgi:hypothetical protein
VLQDARARYAVLKDPVETRPHGRGCLNGGGMEDPEQSSTDDHPICRLEKEASRPRFGDANGLVPLPQNRAVKAGRQRGLGGAGNGPADDPAPRG